MRSGRERGEGGGKKTRMGEGEDEEVGKEGEDEKGGWEAEDDESRREGEER